MKETEAILWQRVNELSERLDTQSRLAAKMVKERDEAIAMARQADAKNSVRVGELKARVAVLEKIIESNEWNENAASDFAGRITDFVIQSMKNGTFYAWLKKTDSEAVARIGG